MPLLADPACRTFGIDQLKKLRIMFHLLSLEHDTVGRLPGVDDFGRDVFELKHLIPDDRFHAIGSEDDIALDFVWLAFPRYRGEGRIGSVGLDVSAGVGKEEIDGLLPLAAFVHGACERGSVADHMRVAVLLSDVEEVDVA